MLALGRAMMAKPRLLLVDEPSVGLAPTEARSIFDALSALNEPGTTILVVEQNAALALATARHAIVLEEGRVTRSAPADELRGDDALARAYLRN